MSDIWPTGDTSDMCEPDETIRLSVTANQLVAISEGSVSHGVLRMPPVSRDVAVLPLRLGEHHLGMWALAVIGIVRRGSHGPEYVVTLRRVAQTSEGNNGDDT